VGSKIPRCEKIILFQAREEAEVGRGKGWRVEVMSSRRFSFFIFVSEIIGYSEIHVFVSSAAMLLSKQGLYRNRMLHRGEVGLDLAITQYLYHPFFYPLWTSIPPCPVIRATSYGVKQSSPRIPQSGVLATSEQSTLWHHGLD
jgi:hypothetical protein